MDNQSFNIEINNQSYSIKCSDGEDHVRLIEGRLRDAVGMLGQSAKGQNLSPYALKVAITLADQGVRDEKERLEQEELFSARLAPLIERLDQLLDPPAEQAPTVVLSPQPV
jgi:cell division protein ZapA (FtsZ GTPase activity inhibitor)